MIEKISVENFDSVEEAKKQNKYLAEITNTEPYQDEKKYYSNLSPEQNQILSEINILLNNFTAKLKSIPITEQKKKLLREKNIKIKEFDNEFEETNDDLTLYDYILGCRIIGATPEDNVTKFDTRDREIEKFIRNLLE
ncbi:MAG: hypothetical protein ABIF22_03155 [bacterium]